MFGRKYPRINQRLKVLYHRSTSDTAKNLARGLGIGYTKKSVANDICVIRWGSSTPCRNDLALQPNTAVRLAAHGLRSLQRLETREVPCVKVYTGIPPEDKFPVVGRAVHHRAGQDIRVLNTIEDIVEPARYYTKLRVAAKEFRVHVFDGKVLKMFRKVERREDAHQKIKTSKRGWGYHRVDPTKYYKTGQRVAINAVEALGLHYGGVDLGVDSDGYYVFEVNTGPALNTKTIKLYTERFREHLIRLGVNYEPIE